MDAREYLTRKGIDTGRDQERPNTLEEKAWARARESGDHRPHAGTPHDWEDWERYHTELADDAARIEQKIDHDAHRDAIEHDGQAAVHSFTPSAGDRVRIEPRTSRSTSHEAVAGEPRAPLIPLILLAILMPPLAVGLAGGGAQRVGINLLLTLLGWLPGVGHALWWFHRRQQG